MLIRRAMSLVVAGAVGLGILVAAETTAPTGDAKQQPPKVVEVAPAPKAVPANRVYQENSRAKLEQQNPAAPMRENGVEWRVAMELRNTKRDRVLDFNWQISYTGRRRPLVILEPSLVNPNWATSVVFYVFPSNRSRPGGEE